MERSSCLLTENLRFDFWPQLWRNCADEPRLKSEPAKDGSNFPEGDDRLFEFHVNQVVIAIDLVMQARNSLELVIEFQDLAQIADAGGINFQFDHSVNDDVTFMGQPCKIGIVSARNTPSRLHFALAR